MEIKTEGKIMKFKKVEMIYNEDGEFGQKTGWLVKQTYIAPVCGNETSISETPEEVVKNAIIPNKIMKFILKHFSTSFYRFFGNYLYFFIKS